MENFSESEKLQLFAEIISASKTSASNILLRYIINEELADIDWNNTALPQGRTVNQCQQVLSDSRAVLGSRPDFSGSRSTSLTGQPAAVHSSYPYPDTTPGRFIQPRPPGVQNPPPRVHSPYSAPILGDTQQRKRGRPSKADMEARRAAELRGDAVTGRPRQKKQRRSMPEGGLGSLSDPRTPAASDAQSRSPVMIHEVSKTDPSPVTATDSASSAGPTQSLGLSPGQHPAPGRAAVSEAGPATPLSESQAFPPPESRDRRTDHPPPVQLPSLSSTAYLPAATTYPPELPQRSVASSFSFTPASRPPGGPLSFPSSVLSPAPQQPRTREPERR